MIKEMQSRPKTIKLDLKDRKILTLLDENARYTNAQIAKRVGLSKPAVEYRISRLKKNEAIFAFYTVINFTKLGYNQYKLYLKFQDTSIEKEKQISKYWFESSNTVWIGNLRGKWDMAVSILAHSNFEFGKILSEFMSRFSSFILEKDVLLTEYSPIYAREYLTETKPSEFVYGVPSEIYSLSEIDKKILKNMSNSSRISIIDLADRTKLSRDIINYRIKKLQKENIIVQYRAYLNLPKIGIKLYKVILRMKNFSPAEEKNIKMYVEKHKQATQLLKLIGSYDLEIEFETENENQLYEVLNELRQKFSDVIRDLDIVRVTETIKYDFFPFNI